MVISNFWYLDVKFGLQSFKTLCYQACHMTFANSKGSFEYMKLYCWVLLTTYLLTKSSLPIGLAELWESEPIGTCKNNNPIHDQGCGYNYLDDRPSKWGFPLTLTKTTWIFNFYCTAVFLKAIQLPWTRWFQKCITLGCQIPRSSF